MVHGWGDLRGSGPKSSLGLLGATVLLSITSRIARLVTRNTKGQKVSGCGSSCDMGLLEAMDPTLSTNQVGESLREEGSGGPQPKTL